MTTVFKSRSTVVLFTQCIAQVQPWFFHVEKSLARVEETVVLGKASRKVA